MISTYGELVAAIRTWLATPLKWEKKIQTEVKIEVKDIYHKRIEDLMNPGVRSVFDREMAKHEYEKRQYIEWKKRMGIPFCEKCEGVGCDECSTWHMNQ